MLKQRNHRRGKAYDEKFSAWHIYAFKRELRTNQIFPIKKRLVILPELSEKHIMLPSYERQAVIYNIFLTVSAPPFGYNKKLPSR
mgnify:CR=1 FL=1